MSTSNHLRASSTEINGTSLCIWFFHDQRAGHLKQLQGLASRLQAHAQIDAIWLDITDYRLGIRHLFRPPESLQCLPKPDLVIGAGHQTHLSVLLAAHHFKAFSTLIMKPSLPLSWFDALICPEHDQVPASVYILSTFGPLNSVTPPKHEAQPTARHEHLILIGGPSRHYRFEAKTLLIQIQQLCQENSEIHWTLSNSPRTPKDFLPQLKALNLPNLTLHDYSRGSLPALDHLLTQTTFTWMTPDSMSMIFEALTAGTHVGLFDAAPQAEQSNSRIVKQIQALLDNSKVIGFNDRKTMLETKESQTEWLWETDRAARWLLERHSKVLRASNSFDQNNVPMNQKKQRLRILQVLPSMVSGGVERGTLDLSRYLIEQGHQVWVCSSGGPLVENLQQSGARHIQLPVNSKNPFRAWLNSRRLIQLQQTHHFDLLHVRSRAPAWSVLWARKQLNIPIISTFHGQYGHHNRLKRFYNQAMLNTDVCIAVSEFIEQHIQSTYPEHRCQLKLIRRGIDLQLFTAGAPLHEKVRALRAQWQISEQHKVIILPGRLTRLKGHRIFLEALLTLKQNRLGQSIRCLIVGDAPGKDAYRKELEAFILAHELDDIVHFTGICYDMPAMYAVADIVISASTKPEAFGRTACEAQAMGCLVVATKHGGSLETIAPSQRQFMCEQNNSASMAQAIEHALMQLKHSQQQALDEIIQDAQKYIEQHFSLARMCRETEQLYWEFATQKHISPFK